MAFNNSVLLLYLTKSLLYSPQEVFNRCVLIIVYVLQMTFILSRNNKLTAQHHNPWFDLFFFFFSWNQTKLFGWYYLFALKSCWTYWLSSAVIFVKPENVIKRSHTVPNPFTSTNFLRIIFSAYAKPIRTKTRISYVLCFCNWENFKIAQNFINHEKFISSLREKNFARVWFFREALCLSSNKWVEGSNTLTILNK